MSLCDWSSDVCSSDLPLTFITLPALQGFPLVLNPLNPCILLLAFSLQVSDQVTLAVFYSQSSLETVG